MTVVHLRGLVFPPSEDDFLSSWWKRLPQVERSVRLNHNLIMDFAEELNFSGLPRQNSGHGGGGHMTMGLVFGGWSGGSSALTTIKKANFRTWISNARNAIVIMCVILFL
ncbi:unnamed protein product [Ilex paraguariensis]|uniref:Uncharacterized protein n=1 Tax=Ilex paraguariensis TaxID=185542 RepID=A0ABC8S240_9AQUA